MKFVRILAGILLLPCCVAVSRTVYLLFLAINNDHGSSMFWLATGAGLGGWLLVFMFLPAPIKSYILAHELTHAIWGHFMGASVLGMRVSKNGGNVRLTETNVFIALAPYFFPLYAFLVMAAYFLASVFWDLEKYFPGLLAAMGFTLGFHMFFTIMALLRKQPDVEVYGKFFSFTLIYFMNAILICLLLVMVSPVTLFQFFERFAADFAWIFRLIANLLIFGCESLLGSFFFGKNN